jgi:hypothetical protein
MSTFLHSKPSLILNVETVQVHDLDPSRHEVGHQLVLPTSLSIHLSDGPQFCLRAKDEIGSGSSPLLRSSRAILTSEQLSSGVSGPLGAHVEEVDEVVVSELAGLLRQYAVG